MKNNFSNSTTVIGIHVRAGNGEGGDFERKGRTIQNPVEWVGSVCKLIYEEFSTRNELPAEDDDTRTNTREACSGNLTTATSARCPECRRHSLENRMLGYQAGAATQ